MYRLSYEEFDEARRLMEKAEDILRKESLLLAGIINQAHFTIAAVKRELEELKNEKSKK